MFLIDTVYGIRTAQAGAQSDGRGVVRTAAHNRSFLSIISIGEIERGIARQTRILRARLRPGWIGC
jgi:hypothetical protein